MGHTEVDEREELRLRVRELDALYRVADAVATTTTLDGLFSEALDALLDATAADGAALLLADEAGTMRLEAESGVSQADRAATDGSSPWAAATAEATPVFAHEPERALVPLVRAGRIVGMVALFADASHTWEDREIRLCLTIANHLASATVRMQTAAELRASREQLETIMATVDEGILVQAPDGRLVYGNDGAARALGFGSVGELLAGDRGSVLDRFDVLDDQRRPLAANELPAHGALEGRTRERVICYRARATGEERWSIVRANPVRDDTGAVVAAVSVVHDITRWRDAEEQAREGAEVLDAVFGSAPVGLGYWDHELRYVRANAALAEMNGVAPADLIGRNIFDVAPALEPLLRPLLEHVLETGEPVLETDVQAGRRLWRASFYAVRDAAGRPRGVGGVIADVTAARRAEDRIRFLSRAGELLNQTLDSAETLGALADLAVPAFAGHVTVDVFVDGALRCVGARHADPAKTALLRRLREQYPPTVDGHPVQRALREGTVQVVADVQADAHAMAHDHTHAAGIAELGNESGIVVPLIARGSTYGAITFGTVPPQPPFDATDVELAVELGIRASAALDNALLYEQAQTRAHAVDALEFVDDGVFLVDGEGIVRLWNPAAARTFRVRADRAIDRHVSESIADWETLSVRVAEARRSKTLPLTVKGEERWLAASAARYGGGTVYAFRDLTQEHAIEQLRSDFVSTVSHELRTPLAAIYGAALTLQRNDVRLEESQRSGLLDVISSEADRLARIVNDILWASRLDSGQMGMAIESCDAEALAAQVIGALRTHAPETIRLEVDAEPGLPQVAADADKLRQVLTNLVDNAIKYSPDGGHVYVLVTRSGNRIRFRVRDEGLGVPPGEQARIFEKFFRLDPNLTRGVGGTGLGLYICRELVERMHGRIGVTSDGRTGSTFWVELPVTSSP